jgi:hypothetical protein
MLVLLVVLAACASVAVAQVTAVRSYLASVYSQSDFSKLSDADVTTFYNSLTFYYPGYPTSNFPQRSQSFPYACTMCDCLHIQLPMCQNRTQPGVTCSRWPVATFLDIPYVTRHQLPGIPSNSWFEGITFPGEWAFPISCVNASMGRSVYAFHRTIWLYPTTGTGIWFNSGNTAAAYNKVSWLLTYGTNLGATLDQKMDAITSMVCTGYQNRTSCNFSCSDTQRSDPTYCCCHGRHGRNLGTQVYDVKTQFGLTWQQALVQVAGYYQQGKLGSGQSPDPYPVGTFFAVLDKLDAKIKRDQEQMQVDSVQLLREPQHGTYNSQPDYAFEMLEHTPFDGRSYYRWADYCNPKQQAIAVLDPLTQFKNYTQQGYVSGSVATKRIDAFVPRPQFAALFQ